MVSDTIYQPVTAEAQEQAVLYWNRAGATEHGFIHKENLKEEQISQEEQQGTGPPWPTAWHLMPWRHQLSSSGCQTGKPPHESLSDSATGVALVK